MIALACLGVTSGIILAPHVSSSLFYSLAWLVVGIFVIGIVFWRPYIWSVPVVIGAGVIVGLWRGSIDQTQLGVYEHLMEVTTTITGNVSEDVDTNARGESVIRLSELTVDAHKLPGKMYVTASPVVDIKRGDVIAGRGRITEGFGTFPAAMYRADITNVKRPEPGDIARRVRDWFADAIRVAIPEPQASLGIGYLVGQRRALPTELSDALQIAGLTHIVVASGYNLTILVRFARRAFEKVSKYLAALSSGLMIGTFVLITGLSPSMSRAGLVAGLALLAWYYGRKFHPIVLLLFAAAVTLLINPSFGWNDLGWQLSFAAFEGVMIVAPLTQAYFFGEKKPGVLRQILGETISAQLVTFPILVLAFGQFSNVAVIANLLVLPLVPLAMLLTFVAGIVSLIMPGLALLAGLPASWLLGYMTSVASYLAGLSWAQTEVTITPWHVAGMYVLMLVGCVYMWRKTRFSLRDSSIID